MPKRLFILGAGGHAASVAEIAISAGFELVAFVSSTNGSSQVLGYPVLAGLPKNLQTGEDCISIAVGTNFIREKIWLEIQRTYPIDMFPALIHPSASIAMDVEIGFGSTVHQNAVVGVSSKTGYFAIVNTSASTDHDSLIGDFASVGPGAHLGGNVELGARTAIGIGAAIRHGVKIGSDVVLGAASYANESIEEGSVAFGVPAKVHSRRLPDSPYL